MYRALHLVPVLMLAAAPAAAQDLILPGQSVTGELSAADPELDDGSHYDVWRFAAQARHRYRVTLRSDDFDAYLSVGSHAVEACNDCASDDDGAGGTDALVEFTGPADGTYVIRANAYDEAQTGRYRLTLEDRGVVEEHDEHGDAADAGTPIGLAQPVAGTLARGDRKVGSSYSDTWTYQGREGETIVVTLRSEDFDAYLTLGEFDGGECTDMDANDNGAGGTDSRITVELPGDGAFHIHVSAKGQGETGAYTLLVEQAVDRESGAPPMPISPGETLDGRLSESDTREADGSYREAWTFRGDAGETFTITLRSDEFDALLHVGRIVDGEWEMMETDDDGAGDGDAELSITLPESGEYMIRAGSYLSEETGAYTLQLRRR
ncbi:MAG TPA: PPC domain-containing protein [Longimicrobium sp.]